MEIKPWQITPPLPEYLYDIPIVGDVARWLNKVYEQLYLGFAWLINKVWDALPDWVKNLITKFNEFVRDAWDNFTLLFTDPYRFFKKVFNWLWPLFPDWLKDIITNIENFFAVVYENLKKFVSDPVGTLAGLVDRIWNAFPKEIRDAITTAKDTVVKFPSLLVAKAQEFGATVANAFDSAKKFVEDKVKEWGENLGKGLESARDKIMAAFDGAQNAISNALGKVPGDWWGKFWSFWTKDFPADVATVFSFLSPFKLSSWIATLMGYGRGISDKYKESLNKFYDKLKQLSKGELKGDPITLYTDIMATVAEVVTEIEMSTAAIELAVPWKTTGLGGSLGGELLDMTVAPAVDSLRSTFFEALMRWPTRVINSILRGNYPDINTAAEMYYRGDLKLGDLVQILVESGFDDKYIQPWINLITNRLPPLRDLMRMYARGEAIWDDVVRGLEHAGIPEWWHDKYRYLMFDAPGEDKLFNMFFRGIINEETLNRKLRWHGYCDEDIEALKKQAWYYPSVSDLIRFFVREAIPAVYGELARAKLADMPSEFYDYVRKVGMPEEWAEAHWASHWVLPSASQVYEMMWRGLPSPYTGRPMTEEDVARFLREADIDPRWRGNLVEIAYRLPERREARWGLEWGIWDEKRMEQFLRATGLHPDYIPDVIAIEKKNVFREHYNAIMAAAKRAFQRGFMTKDQYLATIGRLGFPQEVQELRAWEADLLFDIELKEDQMKYVIQQYRDGQIDETQLRDMLSSIIVDSQKLEKVVQLEVALKQRRKVEKPALEEQIAALERRRTELQRKLLDLDSDKAQLEKIRDAEMAIWQAKIAKQEELIQMAVKPEQREKLQLDLEIMKRQMERARIYYENRLAELEETMNFVRQDIDAITSQIEAMRKAAAS